VETTGVAASPGAGFGKSGEGYVRFALVHAPAVLEAVVERMAPSPTNRGGRRELRELRELRGQPHG